MSNERSPKLLVIEMQANVKINGLVLNESQTQPDDETIERIARLGVMAVDALFKRVFSKTAYDALAFDIEPLSIGEIHFQPKSQAEFVSMIKNFLFTVDPTRPMDDEELSDNEKFAEYIMMLAFSNLEGLESDTHGCA